MEKDGTQKKIFGMQNKNNSSKIIEAMYLDFLKNLSLKINKFYSKNYFMKDTVYNKQKNKFDPVTILDKKFEEIIRKEINKKFKDHNIIGEEYGDDGKKSHYNWIIDPIDGTKSLIAGNPTWSNLVGLDYMKKPIVGLANFPELNKFYIAKRDVGHVYFKKKKKKLKVSTNINFKTIKIAGAMTCFLKYRQKKKLRQLTNIIQFHSFDSLSIGNFCEGKIDAVIGCGNKSWDIHPWIPIVKSAGGFITNWSGDEVDKGGNVLFTNNLSNQKKIINRINSILV